MIAWVYVWSTHVFVFHRRLTVLLFFSLIKRICKVHCRPSSISLETMEKQRQRKSVKNAMCVTYKLQNPFDRKIGITAYAEYYTKYIYI